ncbi:Retrovirus-related Pol polyprotein from transposon RE2 [Vitis vinifera]|uniref:Retrovirus-related Pol polyprotein from transposon RE2 n=1 Tax=Vitis vinifera TaxID=29760 RepID=A0A438BWM8_VITVI|nr:Retrovirus-related Pol polyprotein from transposon RE2 [Vitis vinifera]
MLKVFRCSYFPNLRPYNNPKFQFWYVECTFLGYGIKHKGFKCLDPQGRIYISKDVQFNEKSFPFSKTKSITSLSFIPSPTPTSHFALIPIHSSIMSVPSPSTSSITNIVADQSNSDQTNAKPVLDVSRNVHSMRTRSKAGIFKPKVFMASKEPASIQEAL